MDKKINPKIKEINGPVNIIRMEGTINNIKKVIYLFLDFHLELDEQKECTNIFSKDVTSYFVDTFHNLNENKKIYDFFVEINPTMLINNEPELYVENYIFETLILFMKIFKYNPETNKVSMSDIFKNIRLHYADIRNFFYGVFDNVEHSFSNIIDAIEKDKLNVNHLHKLIESTKKLKDGYLSTINAITEIENMNYKKKEVVIKNENISNEEYFSKRLYLLNKIINLYNHQNVKKILSQKIYDMRTVMTNYINELDKLINKFENYLDIINVKKIHLVKNIHTGIYDYGLDFFIKKDISLNILLDIDTMRRNYIFLFVIFIDVYFLRRFLDKDYITNGIIYMGALHCIDYIDILLNDFGFRITNASYSKINNLDELNKTIPKYRKNVKHIGQLAEYLNEFLLPPILNQCSDISNFPKNFE